MIPKIPAESPRVEADPLVGVAELVGLGLIGVPVAFGVAVGVEVELRLSQICSAI